MITIYSGLMGAGKTESLLKTYFLTKEDKRNKVLLVKNTIDRQKSYVQSRSGLKSLADLILKSNEIGVLDCMIKQRNITHCFIDECEFFDYDLVYLVQNNKRVHFYLSGLERNYLKKPFGYLSVIKNLCEHENIYFSMNCQECNEVEAKHCFRLVADEAEILVGDKEYRSVCDACYDLLNEMKKEGKLLV